MDGNIEATELTFADKAVRELIESLDGTTTALQNAQETLVNEHVELTNQLANHIEDNNAHGAGMLLRIKAAIPRPVWNGTSLGFQSEDGTSTTA